MKHNDMVQANSSLSHSRRLGGALNIPMSPVVLAKAFDKLQYDLRYSGNASSDVPSAQQQHISDINEEV
ncbi:hypothetical protein CTAM01_16998 [Colletotrichum tamarilloi]|uniref:Uncharacterized protein n=1 Tax=Colletotrichum tamarilloi TaxID=1209934 RepID=A0ABQ9QGX6_9PEZI|nr:uncharacterized protein CTAM01_16998 [Colletotrichum tamarilloi]KAK1466694.1 hypothetical protein CTAM01_16998 [Colletotrichum tamarilloi]